MSGTQQSLLMYGRERDVNWSNVALLMHCEGTNDGTTFADSSSYARTLTAANGAVTSTTTTLFGIASAKLNSTGAKVYAAHAAELSHGSSDFTVEFSIYLISTNTFGRGVMYKTAGSTTGYEYQFTYGGGSSELTFIASGGAAQDVTLTTGSLGTGTWKKIAVSRNGSTWGIYVDGARVQTAGYAGSLNTTSQSDWLIGVQNSNPDLGPNYYIDEVRITNGVGRYSGSAYTVATGPFPDA